MLGLSIVVLVAAVLVAWSVAAAARTVARAVDVAAGHLANRDAEAVSIAAMTLRHPLWGIEAAVRGQPADDGPPQAPPVMTPGQVKFGVALAWLSSSRMDPARAEECRLAMERVFGMREDEIDEATAIELLRRHGVPEELWRE